MYIRICKISYRVCLHCPICDTDLVKSASVAAGLISRGVYLPWVCLQCPICDTDLAYGTVQNVKTTLHMVLFRMSR